MQDLVKVVRPLLRCLPDAVCALSGKADSPHENARRAASTKKLLRQSASKRELCFGKACRYGVAKLTLGIGPCGMGLIGDAQFLLHNGFLYAEKYHLRSIG